jgi:hypothetical protein
MNTLALSFGNPLVLDWAKSLPPTAGVTVLKSSVPRPTAASSSDDDDDEEDDEHRAAKRQRQGKSTVSRAEATRMLETVPRPEWSNLVSKIGSLAVENGVVKVRARGRGAGDDGVPC